MLDEHYVNDAIDKHGNISLFESSRSYLSDGSLNCISDCDYRCKKKFNGTDCQNTHIKKGDIALEFNHDILTPVLVEELSMTKDEWKERFKLDVYGDFTDDSGLAFSAYYGHVHPFAPTLFPLSCLPYAKILKADMMKMEKEKNKYFNGD